ncbi:hypothetical protein [Dyella sp. OK004]|uniref:hypothetical protein n=1 Tax=Dyella sp. OK004 TaxID=1855292 RepID=UPI001160A65D|nr:hypothetical protein [Dyella sp. OK004]
MEQTELTFKTLNDRIDALPERPGASLQLSRKTKLAYAIGLVAMALGLLATKLLPSNQLYTVVIAFVMLVIELISFAIAIIPQLPLRMPGFQRERREYAEELDFDMPHHLGLVQWLSNFSPEELQRLADYANYRHERMKEKLPLLTGSLEKLGILPVVIALYIQFKGMHWPPQPSWPEIVFSGVLIFCYWACMLQVSVRLRVQLFEILLKKAATKAELRVQQNTQASPA